MLKNEPVFHRVLLKLSGESLLGDQKFGLDPSSIHEMSKSISEVVKLGVQIAIVIGGGNFLRGVALSKTGLDRVTSDHMGMLATVMNGLALRDSFLHIGTPCKLMSSISIPGIVEMYDRRRAIDYLDEGQIVIFVAGTGSPLFSTDSAASLRAIEIDADIVLKATKVDAVYSADPKQFPDAERFKHLSHQEVLDRRLSAMDEEAVYLCREHNMSLRVFCMREEGILKRIVMGSGEGTLITRHKS